MGVDGNARGVWPVMLTPFTDGGAVDYDGLAALIDWYQSAGVRGLFAVCLSSEMFHLSLRERAEAARFVKRRAAVPVIASGHVSCDPEDQLEELNCIADAGVDAVVLISNRLAAAQDRPEVWRDSLRRILNGMDPAMPLGLYECPHPYKRLLSDDELAICAGSGRFRFLKDTCCDIAAIRRRLTVLAGSPMGLFNANAATLLESLRAGAAGFSGVMANFHPELYVWMVENWAAEPEKAELLQAVLTTCSLIERQRYPVNAKAHLHSLGLPIGVFCRSAGSGSMSPLELSELKQMNALAQWAKRQLGIP